MTVALDNPAASDKHDLIPTLLKKTGKTQPVSGPRTIYAFSLVTTIRILPKPSKGKLS